MPRSIYLSQALLDDEDFEVLSDAEQLAWFRVRLDQRIGISGMGRISQRGLGLLLKADENATVAIRSGLERKWWMYDLSTGMLWIRGAYRLEPNNFPVRVATLREIERFPVSKVVGEWLKRYGQRWLVDAVADKEKTEFLRISAPYLDGSDTIVARLGSGPDPDRTGRRERETEVESGNRARAKAASERPAARRRRSQASDLSPAGKFDPDPDRTGSRREPPDRTRNGEIDRSEAARSKGEVTRLYLADRAHELASVRGAVVVRQLESVGTWAKSGVPIYAHPAPAEARAALVEIIGQDRASAFQIEQSVPDAKVPDEPPVDPIEERLRRLLESS